MSLATAKAGSRAGRIFRDVFEKCCIQYSICRDLYSVAGIILNSSERTLLVAADAAMLGRDSYSFLDISEKTPVVFRTIWLADKNISAETIQRIVSSTAEVVFNAEEFEERISEAFFSLCNGSVSSGKTQFSGDNNNICKPVRKTDVFMQQLTAGEMDALLGPYK